jgi:hypothetical protein
MQILSIEDTRNEYKISAWKPEEETTLENWVQLT